MTLNEFLQKSGEYSYLVIAVVSFLFGLFSSLISNAIKRKIEKNNLIEIFLYDIRTNWYEVSLLNDVPISNKEHRIRFHLKGTKITFRGEPELEYEVYNTSFFETEGLKLVQYLKPKSVIAYWKTYGLMRDTEATRKIIKGLSQDHEDLESYKHLFNELVKKFADSLITLERALRK